MSETTYELLKSQYRFEKRGVIDIRGRGQLATYWLLGRLEV